MPYHSIAKAFPSCAIALLLAACGTRESVSAAGETTPAPLETAAEPGPDGVPTPAPTGKRTQAGQPLPAWRAIGTEPFWNVRVEGDTLHFTTPEDLRGRRFTGMPAPHAGGVRYTGVDEGTAFELDIRRGECSDGMSDLVYEFEATFRYGETTYQGCAERAKAE